VNPEASPPRWKARRAPRCARRRLAGRAVQRAGASFGGGAFGPVSEVTDPFTGHRVRTAKAWTFEPSTQTASAVTAWEEIGLDGVVIDRWERGPTRLHSVFRFEIAHLLARTGFEVGALIESSDLLMPMRRHQGQQYISVSAWRYRHNERRPQLACLQISLWEAQEHQISRFHPW